MDNMKRVCTFSMCEKIRASPGLCDSHYQQQKKGQPLRPLRSQPSEVVVLPTHAEIVLRGKGGEEKGRGLIDLDDVDLVSRYRWHLSLGKKRQPICIAGAVAKSLRADGEGREVVLLHRLLLDPPQDLVVDHIDGDPLNNRRSNLHIVTQAENLQNLTARTGSTSSYRGVCFHPGAQKWMARCGLEGKQFYLGVFDSEEAAAKAAADFRAANHVNGRTRYAET